MIQGELIAIYTTGQACAPMVSVPEARAVAGHGLEGDRKFIRVDAPPAKAGPDRELTLIESEAIEAVVRDDNVALRPNETRRNLVTRGVPLNHLVGREFRVGEVRLRGIRLCDPCSHLEGLTRPGVLKGLIHRGGLRAQILNDGVLRVGQPVVAE